VPAEFADGRADVVLAVKDGSGQELFHNFRLSVAQGPQEPQSDDARAPGVSPSGRRMPPKRP
jgi:hypothetical protein